MSIDMAGYISSATLPVTDTPITMSCLFLPDVINLWRGLVYIGEGGGDQYYAMTFSAEVIKAYARAGGSTPIASSGGTVVQNVWNHAATTWTNDSSRAAFLNGGNKGTKSGGGNPHEGQFNIFG